MHFKLNILHTFSTLGLDQEILRSIEEIGYEKPTEIQEKAIPILLGKRGDFIGLAATGTGKTAAFGLPLIQYTDTNKNIFLRSFSLQRENWLNRSQRVTDFRKT